MKTKRRKGARSTRAGDLDTQERAQATCPGRHTSPTSIPGGYESKTTPSMLSRNHQAVVHGSTVCRDAGNWGRKCHARGGLLRELYSVAAQVLAFWLGARFLYWSGWDGLTRSRVSAASSIICSIA